MKCKDCGAHLPYGAYGNIKCEYCGAPNYVPIPGEKEEEVEPAPSRVEKEMPAAPTPGEAKKGAPIGIILLVVVGAVLIGMYIKGGSHLDSYYAVQTYEKPTIEKTPEPTYAPPKTTSAPTQEEPVVQETSGLEGRDVLELIPTRISNYETVERGRFSKSGCRSAARVIYNVDNYGSKVVAEVCEAEDVEAYMKRLHTELSEEGVYSADFMSASLINNVDAKWAHLPDPENNVALYYWIQEPFVFEVTGYSDPIWSTWEIIIAESVANRIIQIQ